MSRWYLYCIGLAYLVLTGHSLIRIFLDITPTAKAKVSMPTTNNMETGHQFADNDSRQGDSCCL